MPCQGRRCRACQRADRAAEEYAAETDGGARVDAEQNADVIQGRLGWESGDISEADPSNLRPHPKNTEIYGDTDDVDDLDATFKESVAEKGVLEPLVITNGKEIISGHRRWLAARDAGLTSVPVRYSEFDNDLAEREALIEFNRQREKTPGQIVNEFEEMLAVEQERAKERKEANLKEGDEQPRRGNVSTSGSKGKARDKAAEKVNADVSGRTLEKGKTVKEKAESEDEPEEVREAAREAWDGLQSGEESFNSAYTAVKDAEKEAEADDDGDDISQFVSQETDEWSSPRELVEPLADAVDGFDLDPCSGAESSPFADSVFTEDDDGLAQDWHGTVWVNPPYSAMSEWTSKALAQFKRDDVERVFYLCKGDSSTDWWQRAAASASVVATIDHRLKFGDGENSAPFASHIFVFGEADDDAITALAEHGRVLRPLPRGEADE
jgi:phage N-6-adenine-methyltransferase